VEAYLQVFEGLSHPQYLFDPAAPETKEAFEEIAAFSLRACSDISVVAPRPHEARVPKRLLPSAAPYSPSYRLALVKPGWSVGRCR
jgi:hypothetical protein